MAVITKFVAPGTVTIIDGWAGYNPLANYGFTHKRLVHEESSANTQGIERAWVDVKAFFKRSRGNTVLLQSHLDEVAWRNLHRSESNSLDLIETFLRDFKRMRCPRM